MGPTVRPATVDDARGIAEVQVASWRAAYRGLLPGAVLAGLSVDARSEHWATIVADPEPRAGTLVAVEDAAVVGFAAFGPRHGDECPQHGQLYAIYLDPPLWGRGLGHLLHGATTARLRALGFTSATLWVLVGNERAIRFYRRAGWRANGVTQVDTLPDGTELPELQLHRELRDRPGRSGLSPARP